MNKISILIPVYNEVNYLEKCISEVKKHCVNKFDFEIIISDNNSTDGSKFILENIKDENIKILFQKTNLGKGSNLRNCFKYVTGDIIIIQDADLEYSPENYSDLLQPIINDRADVVYGNRFARAKPFHVYSLIHLIANKIVTYIINILFNRSFGDVLTGYKVFKTKIIKNHVFNSNNFDIDAELSVFFCKNRSLRIYEVPISIYSRNYSEGKKIKLRHLFILIYTLFKYRF